MTTPDPVAQRIAEIRARRAAALYELPSVAELLEILADEGWLLDRLAETREALFDTAQHYEGLGRFRAVTEGRPYELAPCVRRARVLLADLYVAADALRSASPEEPPPRPDAPQVLAARM